jgi:hypothetical protein
MNATVTAAISARIANGQSGSDARTGVANALISVAVLTRIAEGQSMEEALDAVVGKGTYAKLAGDVYYALRTNAAK